MMTMKTHGVEVGCQLEARKDQNSTIIINRSSIFIFYNSSNGDYDDDDDYDGDDDYYNDNDK